MKNLSLVKSEPDYGITTLDGIPVVSSRRMAEIFDKRHDHILRDIKTLTDDLPKSGEINAEFGRSNFRQSFYRDNGRKYPEYLLTRDGFTLSAMGFTGKKAVQFKIAYINRFNDMERFIRSRNIARLEYPELTDAIKTIHDDPKFYHYSSEADMINRIILGMSAKQFRQQRGMDKGESIRSRLTHRQAEAIQKLQRFDVGLVAIMPDFQERKKALQAYFKKIHDNNHTMLVDTGTDS